MFFLSFFGVLVVFSTKCFNCNQYRLAIFFGVNPGFGGRAGSIPGSGSILGLGEKGGDTSEI